MKGVRTKEGQVLWSNQEMMVQTRVSLASVDVLRGYLLK